MQARGLSWRLCEPDGLPRRRWSEERNKEGVSYSPPRECSRRTFALSWRASAHMAHLHATTVGGKDPPHPFLFFLFFQQALDVNSREQRFPSRSTGATAVGCECALLARGGWLFLPTAPSPSERHLPIGAEREQIDKRQCQNPFLRVGDDHL